MRTITSRIEKALRIAGQVHSGQTRKDDGRTPSFAHAFAVGHILSRYTDDEDVVIAGILHDTVEDTEYTFEQMEKDFGPRVVEIVKGVTDEKDNGETEEAWMEKKKKYLERLQISSLESVWVSVADKIHNLVSMIESFKIQKHELFTKFHAPANMKLWFYEEVLKIAENRIQTGPLLAELEEVLQEAEELFNS